MKHFRRLLELPHSMIRIALLVIWSASVSPAQVTLFQRDQKAWLMQFEGTWRAVVGEDTNITWQATSVAGHKALQIHSLTTVHGATVRESWGFWAYDPETERFSCTTLLSSGELLHATGAFIKRSIFLLALDSQLLNEAHPTSTTMELKPPDTFEASQTNSSPQPLRVFVFRRATE